MARIDRIVARRQESARKPRVVFLNNGPGRRKADVTMNPLTGNPEPHMTSAQHKQGDQWWRSRFVEVIERRRVPDSYHARKEAA